MNTEIVEKEIQDCKACQNVKQITFDKPIVFKGRSNNTVMIIGHSPTVRSKSQAYTVLKLDMPNLQLYKYIIEKILDPLNISIDNVYATNLIKCKTTLLPEDIKNSKQLFEKTFYNCRKLLEKEIESVQPQLIISLSERVLHILSETYMSKKLNMKDSFAQLYKLQINGKEYDYIPVVHLPKGRNSNVAKTYFPYQVDRLKMLRKKVN